MKRQQIKQDNIAVEVNFIKKVMFTLKFTRKKPCVLQKLDAIQLSLSTFKILDTK